MLIPGISIIHSSVKKWWSVAITTFNLPNRRGHAGREAIPLAYRGGTPTVRPEYPWKLMRVFPSSTMFPLYMYVCMQSTWCMNVVQYWRKKRRESRAGSDVISVTRLRDWRDGELKGQIESRPDTSPLPSRVLSNNRCCAVRLELERDSARVGFVVYLRFPLSFFLSFRFYYEWARAENGGGKEGQGRGFQDEGYLRRVLFFISRGKFVG